MAAQAVAGHPGPATRPGGIARLRPDPQQAAAAAHGPPIGGWTPGPGRICAAVGASDDLASLSCHPSRRAIRGTYPVTDRLCSVRCLPGAGGVLSGLGSGGAPQETGACPRAAAGRIPRRLAFAARAGRCAAPRRVGFARQACARAAGQGPCRVLARRLVGSPLSRRVLRLRPLAVAGLGG